MRDAIWIFDKTKSRIDFEAWVFLNNQVKIHLLNLTPPYTRQHLAQELGIDRNRLKRVLDFLELSGYCTHVLYEKKSKIAQ